MIFFISVRDLDYHYGWNYWWKIKVL